MKFHAHWQVESGDLAKFGLIPEFIGRLPILVSLAALNEDQLVQVVSIKRNSFLLEYPHNVTGLSLDVLTHSELYYVILFHLNCMIRHLYNICISSYMIFVLLAC